MHTCSHETWLRYRGTHAYESTLIFKAAPVYVLLQIPVSFRVHSLSTTPALLSKTLAHLSTIPAHLSRVLA